MTESTRILFFSDLHLGRGRLAWASLGIEGDAYVAAESLAEAAEHHRCDAIVGAGDLIDKRRNCTEPIHRAASFVDRATMPFAFVQGQHEFDDPPWFSLLAPAAPFGAVHLHERLWKIGCATLYGLDYRSRDELELALAAIPETAHTLVCHQVWDEFMGSIAAPQGSLASIPHHVRLVVTGDYHQHLSVEVERPGGPSLRVLSPGACSSQKIDEPHEHAVFVVEYHPNGDFDVVSQQLPSRPIYDFGVCRTDADRKRLLDCGYALLRAAKDLPTAIAKPLVRIDLPPGRDLPEIVPEQWLDSIAWMRRTVGEDTSAETISVDSSADDALATLREFPGVDPETLDLAEKIFGGGDPRDGVKKWSESLRLASTT